VEWKDTKKKLEKLQKERASQEAKEVKFESIDKIRVLIKEIHGSPAQLQEMSRQLSADDTLIILFSSEGRVFASSGKDVKHDCSHIIKHVCEKMGGRGGGRTNLAQGNGKPAMIKAGIEEARRLLK
jgi:alanyl-tRNA synthetase